MDFTVMKESILHADDGLIALAEEAAGRMGRKIHFGFAITGDGYMEP